MTILELYEYANERNILNYNIEVTYWEIIHIKG